MRVRTRTIVGAALLLIGLTAYADEWVTKASSLHIDVSRIDSRIAMDLRGTIWLLSVKGGQASALTDPAEHASRPRWAPDGQQILYQVRDAQGSSLWLIDIASRQSNPLSSVSASDQLASWHPDGTRIVFSSTRDGVDFDIWETDIATGLKWRVTNDPGDEIEAVWSADGDDLAYISVSDGVYSVMLRRGGQPAISVMSSSEPLSSLAWRPDGTLLTVLRDDGYAFVSEMIILSDPPLVRKFITDPNLQSAAVTWLDRSRHLFVADGAIKTRAFGDLQGRLLPFRALVESPELAAPRSIPQRELPVVDAPDDRLVIRGARLFDGIWAGYRNNMDVLIDGGRVIAIEPRRDWDSATVLDLGDVTIMPGFVDSWGALATEPTAREGARLLSYGITTIVADLPQVGANNTINWESETTPGPRLLHATGLNTDPVIDEDHEYFLAAVANGAETQDEFVQMLRDWHEVGLPIAARDWRTFLSANADVLLGLRLLPPSAFEARHANVAASGRGILPRRRILVSSDLAGADTPGVEALHQSRQARTYGHKTTNIYRRTVQDGELSNAVKVLVGSGGNGLPAGFATHAEFRSLQAHGLNGEQILHASGKNIADALGLVNQIGTLSAGAVADLVLIQGDPLTNIEDAINIVAVVRNGRFFSLVSLLDRGQ